MNSNEPDESPFELPFDKAARARRIHVNRKHKRRDRWKTKQPKLIPSGAPQKYRRFRLWARENTRHKTDTETGYGVAYERRSDNDLFSHP